MKKSYFVWMLAAALCFPLIGCSDDNDGEDQIEVGGGSGDDNNDDNGNNDDDDIVGVQVYNGHECVDMGGSVMWATCNIGAETTEGYGGYYAWGETEEKQSYAADAYTLKDEQGNFLEIADICGTEYDVARKLWGGEWRMPSLSEFSELLLNCVWVKMPQNGVNGYVVTAKNGNRLFFPLSGYKWDDFDDVSYEGGNGSYWTGTAYEGTKEGDIGNAYFLCLGNQYRLDYSLRRGGQPIRAVFSKE